MLTQIKKLATSRHSQIFFVSTFTLIAGWSEPSLGIASQNNIQDYTRLTTVSDEPLEDELSDAKLDGTSVAFLSRFCTRAESGGCYIGEVFCDCDDSGN